MQSAIISVHIRKKRLNNGNESLYLDIYSDGERSYEFLKLYLVPETNRKSKSENKETLRVAESMRIQRIAELQKSRASMERGSKTNLIRYIEQCISKKSKGTASTYRCVLVAAKSFFGDKFVLEEITEDDVKRFFNFIENYPNRNVKGKIISPTTQSLYCITFKSFLNQAAKENLIQRGIADNVEIPKKTECARNYLTIEELQLLANTKLNYWYKKCFIFSCLTGLRRSDVKRLTWGDVTEQDGFTRIIFRQKKTGSIEYLDIVPLARKIMGERKGYFDKVFTKFQCDSRTNKAIQKWAESVGIHKKLTFHCARHTFAVMMLTLDTDIYTVSKLLGHKELSTTQIYAKIVDKKKQEAVTKIPIVI